MADDRIFSKSLGHGDRITMLSDLEFRVWSQYELSADDFGVMRFSVLQIQNDHAALAKRPQKAIQKALTALLSVGLVVGFSHQGQPFVCQLDWQNYQKKKYTKHTLLPKPPGDILDRCTSWTRHLFQFHPGGCSIPRFSESSEKISENIPKDSQNISPSRETLTLIPNANSHADPIDVLLDRFLREEYPPEGYQAGWEVDQAWAATFEGVDRVEQYQRLCDAVRQHKRSIQWLDGKIPLALKWLKEKRWNQRLPEPVASEDNVLKMARERLARNEERYGKP